MIHSGGRTILITGGAETRLPPSVRSSSAGAVCTLLAACDCARRGQPIRERLLYDDELRTAHQPGVNRNVGNSRLNLPVLKLIFAGQIDALHKERRALGQVSRLADGNSCLGIQPQRTIDEAHPLLAGNYSKNVGEPVARPRTSRVMNFVVGGGQGNR